MKSYYFYIISPLLLFYSAIVWNFQFFDDPLYNEYHRILVNSLCEVLLILSCVKMYSLVQQKKAYKSKVKTLSSENWYLEYYRKEDFHKVAIIDQRKFSSYFKAKEKLDEVNTNSSNPYLAVLTYKN